MRGLRVVPLLIVTGLLVLAAFGSSATPTPIPTSTPIPTPTYTPIPAPTYTPSPVNGTKTGV